MPEKLTPKATRPDPEGEEVFQTIGTPEAKAPVREAGPPVEEQRSPAAKDRQRALTARLINVSAVEAVKAMSAPEKAEWQRLQERLKEFDLSEAERPVERYRFVHCWQGIEAHTVIPNLSRCVDDGCRQKPASTLSTKSWP